MAIAKFQKHLTRIKDIGAQWQDKPFAAALKLMYEQTMEKDRGLKDVAIKFVAENSDTLLECPHIRQACLKIGEIGLDILTAQKTRDQQLANCPVVAILKPLPRNGTIIRTALIFIAIHACAATKTTSRPMEEDGETCSCILLLGFCSSGRELSSHFA